MISILWEVSAFKYFLVAGKLQLFQVVEQTKQIGTKQIWLELPFKLNTLQVCVLISISIFLSPATNQITH